MINLMPGYARLAIEADQPFDQVTESMRMLVQLCRLNKTHALVVSQQASIDWRSSMRVALRFITSRGPVPNIKLAFVVKAARQMQDEVLSVVERSNLHCAAFANEAEAVAWLNAGGLPPTV